MKEEIRLNKYISEAGFCSRREADELIATERVTVNGILAQVGMRVKPIDRVRIDGETLKHPDILPAPMQEPAKRSESKPSKPKSLYEREEPDPAVAKRNRPQGRKGRQGKFAPPRPEQAAAKPEKKIEKSSAGKPQVADKAEKASFAKPKAAPSRPYARPKTVNRDISAKKKRTK